MREIERTTEIDRERQSVIVRETEEETKRE